MSNKGVFLLSLCISSLLYATPAAEYMQSITYHLVYVANQNDPEGEHLQAAINVVQEAKIQGVHIPAIFALSGMLCKSQDDCGAAIALAKQKERRNTAQLHRRGRSLVAHGEEKRNEVSDRIEAIQWLLEHATLTDEQREKHEALLTDLSKTFNFLTGQIAVQVSKMNAAAMMRTADSWKKDFNL